MTDYEAQARAHQKLEELDAESQRQNRKARQCFADAMLLMKGEKTSEARGKTEAANRELRAFLNRVASKP